MYFTSKASLKKKYPSNREEAPVLLRKRGAPTLCIMSNHRKLWSPEGKNIARGGDLGHSLFTDLRKWKPFFPFGFSPLIIQTWLATWWITQGPSASERCKRRKFSSDTLVRRPRFQKGIWSKGPTEKKTVCSITLGQSITAATGRWALALGTKDVWNLEPHIPAQMGEQHSHRNLLARYLP